MIAKARSRMSSGATSTSGRRTSPALEMFTSPKSGLSPGRTAGAGTWKESGLVADIETSRLNRRRGYYRAALFVQQRWRETMFACSLSLQLRTTNDLRNEAARPAPARHENYLAPYRYLSFLPPA